MHGGGRDRKTGQNRVNKRSLKVLLQGAHNNIAGKRFTFQHGNKTKHKPKTTGLSASVEHKCLYVLEKPSLELYIISVETPKAGGCVTCHTLLHIYHSVTTKSYLHLSSYIHHWRWIYQLPCTYIPDPAILYYDYSSLYWLSNHLVRF